MFCMAIKPPKLVMVSAQVATTIAALGADALDHSMSTAASTPSPLKPGSAQLPPFPGPTGCGWTCESQPLGNMVFRPKAARKVFQSAAEKISLSSTTTIV
jgi:hypothetical protein